MTWELRIILAVGAGFVGGAFDNKPLALGLALILYVFGEILCREK